MARTAGSKESIQEIEKSIQKYIDKYFSGEKGFSAWDFLQKLVIDNPLKAIVVGTEKLFEEAVRTGKIGRFIDAKSEMAVWLNASEEDQRQYSPLKHKESYVEVLKHNFMRLSENNPPNPRVEASPRINPVTGECDIALNVFYNSRQIGSTIVSEPSVGWDYYLQARRVMMQSFGLVEADQQLALQEQIRKNARLLQERQQREAQQRIKTEVEQQIRTAQQNGDLVDGDIDQKVDDVSGEITAEEAPKVPRRAFFFPSQGVLFSAAPLGIGNKESLLRVNISLDEARDKIMKATTNDLISALKVYPIEGAQAVSCDHAEVERQLDTLCKSEMPIEPTRADIFKAYAVMRERDVPNLNAELEDSITMARDTPVVHPLASREVE